MKVKEVMHKSPVVVTSDTKVKEVWKLLFRKKINSISVVDRNNKIKGIVVKDDLLSMLYPDYAEYISDFRSASNLDEIESKLKDVGDKKITCCMNRKVIFTREDTHVMRALSRMITQHVNQLPVLDAEDRVVGILTKGDVFYMLFQKRLSR